MDMSPQQQQPQVEGEDEMFSRSRSGSQHEQRSKMKFQSCRRQSAPSLVITKALTRSKTLSRETFQATVCAETCPFIQSYLDNSVRSFLLHTHAQLKTGMQTQDRHLFLFSDIMIVAKAKSVNHFKLKVKVHVCEMWTASYVEEVCEGSTNLKRSFVIGWPTYNCVATFSSSEQKEEWLKLLKSCIKEQKEAEEPKTIPLRVYGKGLNTFAVTKTLPVSNSDSTNEVIRLALQQFSIIGNVKDYQLWVISKRDASYPLIGHEFPFSIQMSHVRTSMSQGGGTTVGFASPVDRENILQKELLQVSRQCQFVLKPRQAEEQQLLLQEPGSQTMDFPQKTFRRRRSLVSWAFWRGSTSYLSELSLTGAAHGCLFGRPLSSVCVENSLPKPIMDMLTVLYHEGSWTRGIFRRPAGARAVRELRDSLDAGEFQLPLTRDHVFLIAGVFKDFLRSIPGSLLCCELHAEWMDVLEDDDNNEGRVQDIQRLMHRLPKENALLLRYLLAVLHTIQVNGHENQMNAFNLSVCIAPSMLWPPGAPSSPEVEGKETKKVCELVRFMMEHCQLILGEEPTTLFGGPPQKCQSDETTTDSWLYPMTDSSYDSLENELDDSSGGSPALQFGHLQSKPLQGSQDSIITISDCDHEASPDLVDSQLQRSVNLCSLVRTGGRRQVSNLHTSQEILSMSTPSSVDFLSMGLPVDGQHKQRRMSEPNIYLGRFGPCTSGSTDVTNLHQTNSPTNSVNSDQTFRATLESQPTKMSNEICSVPATDAKNSPPREGLSWGTLKSCGGLHPNSWLRKDRKLSLTQEDNTVKSEEKEKSSLIKLTISAGDKQHPVYTQGGTNDVSLKGRGGKQRICRVKKVSGGQTLSFFKKHKSHSVEKEEMRQETRLCLRRRSEPGRHIMEQPDPGLKVMQTDSERAACFSPSTTKSVKKLFSPHPGSGLHSSQQAAMKALTLVESHKLWLRRCSELDGDPDCEQPLFGGESFV